MRLFIKSQREYENAVIKGLHMRNELVIQNSVEFIKVSTDVTVGKDGRCITAGDTPITITGRENAMITAEGKSTVIGYDHANIIAKGNCKITLRDSSFAHCFGHCHIELRDKTKLNAAEHCTAYAYDESAVSASGSSKVYAEQKATARGTDVASLSGKGESTLSGFKNCSITAKDNCVVYAFENCTVKASDNCLVVAGENAKIISRDNCLIMSKGKADIQAFDTCEHVNLDMVTGKNIMGTLKQMAQSRAAAERPYAAIQILKDNIPQERKEAVNRRLAVMGLKDQSAAKDYLYSLIEARPPLKTQNAGAGFDRQLEIARKAGFVQGVCECAAATGEERNMGKKLLSEMNVTKPMAKKYANAETYRALEKSVFAQKQEVSFEKTRGIKR